MTVLDFFLSLFLSMQFVAGKVQKRDQQSKTLIYRRHGDSGESRSEEADRARSHVYARAAARFKRRNRKICAAFPSLILSSLILLVPELSTILIIRIFLNIV